MRGIVPRQVTRARSRGLLLPVVLLVVGILALLGASFGFLTRAELRGMQAVADQYQARLTAESGLQRIMLLLRSERYNMDAWWNNPDQLRHSVVWLPGEDPSQYGPRTAIEEGQPAWRFSVVADDPDSDEPDSVRFGLTDEAGKLNINTADRDQLIRLFSELLGPEVEADALAEALEDWRDADDETKPKGAENDDYALREPPTRCKNAPLESVEELLLVRGFRADILYGEDMNRNGILEPNEDDGEKTLPNDNADGQLSRGLYPYLTVSSRELNTANDNRPRINIKRESAESLSGKLQEFFSPAVVEFIAEVRRTNTPVSTPAELYGLTTIGNSPTPSPISLEEMPAIMDRLTVEDSSVFPGPPGRGPAALVNVNTAAPAVLRAVGIPPEDVSTIVASRGELTGEQKATTAWLLTHAGLSPQAFVQAAKLTTARAMQFTVESLGYAEHVGAFCRLEAIIEMRGQAAAVLYLRDLTSLGMGYPVRLEFGEGTFARQTRR